MQENFTVKNVKCGGCSSAIINGLKDLPGVAEVKVDIPSGEVVIEGEALSRETLGTKLSDLGYPEA